MSTSSCAHAFKELVNYYVELCFLCWLLTGYLNLKDLWSNDLLSYNEISLNGPLL